MTFIKHLLMPEDRLLFQTGLDSLSACLQAALATGIHQGALEADLAVFLLLVQLKIEHKLAVCLVGRSSKKAFTEKKPVLILI